jgi:hypothetical protein
MMERAIKLRHVSVPKKGKQRLALKKPAAATSIKNLMKKIKYVWYGKASEKSRRDREKWSANLKDVYSMKEKALIKYLTKSGFLKDWLGDTCFMCDTGMLGPLLYNNSRGAFVHKCGHRERRKTVLPHHESPIFNTANGEAYVPLVDQAAVLAVLYCACADVKRSTFHWLTGKNHKLIDNMHMRLAKIRSDFVEKRQASMRFGRNGAWHDVEADEVD